MEKYKIEFKKSAYKELLTIPKKDLKRILKKISSLSENPRPDDCKKLSTLERYRIRQGNYRILYSIEKDKLTIFVVKVGHRKNIYNSF